MAKEKLRSNKEAKSVRSMGVTPEERHELIAVAAYRRAEHRGFAPGAELQDWLEAEAEIDKSLIESTAS